MQRFNAREWNRDAVSLLGPGTSGAMNSAEGVWCELERRIQDDHTEARLYQRKRRSMGGSLSGEGLRGKMDGVD